MRLRTQKEQERLKETRNRMAEAHKEIGELRYKADGELRHLEELKETLAQARKASEQRSKQAETLTSQIETLAQLTPSGEMTNNLEPQTASRKPSAVASSKDRSAKTGNGRLRKNGTTTELV